MKNEHPSFRPSKLDQYGACPGSYTLEKGLPDINKEEITDYGKKLHKVMETGNKKNLDIEALELVERCEDFLTKILVEHRGKIENVQREVKLVIYSYGEILTEGTADLLFETDHEVIVIDWKFGYDKISAKNNLQLLAYGVGASIRANKPCKVYIFQPRLYWSDSPDKYITHLDTLCLDSVKYRCEENTDDYRTGEHCKYCKAFLNNVCYEYKKLVRSFEDNQITLENLPDKDLAKVYADSKLVKRYVALIEKEMKSRVTTNKNCVDYHFKEQKGNRKISEFNILLALEKLENIIDNKQFLGICKVSLSKLEKLFVEKTKAKSDITITTKSCKSIFNDTIGEFIEYENSKFILTNELRMTNESII